MHLCWCIVIMMLSFAHESVNSIGIPAFNAEFELILIMFSPVILLINRHEYKDIPVFMLTQLVFTILHLQMLSFVFYYTTITVSKSLQVFALCL